MQIIIIIQVTYGAELRQRSLRPDGNVLYRHRTQPPLAVFQLLLRQVWATLSPTLFPIHRVVSARGPSPTANTLSLEDALLGSTAPVGPHTAISQEVPTSKTTHHSLSPSGCWAPFLGVTDGESLVPSSRPLLLD